MVTGLCQALPCAWHHLFKMREGDEWEMVIKTSKLWLVWSSDALKLDQCLCCLPGAGKNYKPINDLNSFVGLFFLNFHDILIFLENLMPTIWLFKPRGHEESGSLLEYSHIPTYPLVFFLIFDTCFVSLKGPSVSLSSGFCPLINSRTEKTK